MTNFTKGFSLFVFRVEREEATEISRYAETVTKVIAFFIIFYHLVTLDVDGDVLTANCWSSSGDGVDLMCHTLCITVMRHHTQNTIYIKYKIARG